MSDSETNDQVTTQPSETKKFRRSAGRSRMPAPQARRQGDIVTLAFTTLGGRDAALDFLNSHDASLDARPLDVASESDDGFERVRAIIAARA